MARRIFRGGSDPFETVGSYGLALFIPLAAVFAGAMILREINLSKDNTEIIKLKPMAIILIVVGVIMFPIMFFVVQESRSQ